MVESIKPGVGRAIAVQRCAEESPDSQGGVLGNTQEA